MNCTVVRDRLAEHALGVVRGRDAAAIDHHLAWCAACRTEARDLRGAAAVLPYALPPAEPDPALEGRVVEAVVRARGAGRQAAPRRARLATAAVLAAMFAVAGMGWGAVMAGRAARLEDSAAEAVREQERATEDFAVVVEELLQQFGEAEAYLGLLTPTDETLEASGSALTIVAPRVEDQVLVVVNGLPTGRKRLLPYMVVLAAGRDEVVVGQLDAGDFDTGGVAELGGPLDEDLRRYDRVLVRDARGEVVLRGMLESQAPVATPSP